MECFYEQFQTKDYSKVEKVLKFFSALSLAAAVFFIMSFDFISTAIFALIYLVIFILSRKLIVEYEYELTGDELVIFKIMNKIKRKKIGSFNIRDISSVKSPDKIGNPNTKIVKAYLKEVGLKDMIYMVKTGKEIVGFQLAMDEKLIDFIKKVNPIIFY